MCKAWEGFTAGAWQSRIDVRDFIQKNYTPYGGDEAFLAPATPRTQALMHKLQGLMKLEQEFGGVLDVDTQTVLPAQLQAGLSGQRQRADRRPADGQAAEARCESFRRHPHGAGGLPGLRL